MRNSGLCAIGLAASLLSLSGCAYALHPVVLPSQQTIKLRGESSERYRIRVVNQEYAVGVDGNVRVTLPATRQECTVYLFNLIPISGGKDPRDEKSVSVLAGDRVVKTLSMNQVLKLPVDDSGAHTPTIERGRH